MHMDWNSPFSRRLQRAASERGRRMAKARWAKERERQARLSVLRAEQYPARIVRRIVVIDRETTVREAVIFDFDSLRGAQRKLRAVLRAEK